MNIEIKRLCVHYFLKHMILEHIGWFLLLCIGDFLKHIEWFRRIVLQWFHIGRLSWFHIDHLRHIDCLKHIERLSWFHIDHLRHIEHLSQFHIEHLNHHSHKKLVLQFGQVLQLCMSGQQYILVVQKHMFVLQQCILLKYMQFDHQKQHHQKQHLQCEHYFQQHIFLFLGSEQFGFKLEDIGLFPKFFQLVHIQQQFLQFLWGYIQLGFQQHNNQQWSFQLGLYQQLSLHHIQQSLFQREFFQLFQLGHIRYISFQREYTQSLIQLEYLQQQLSGVHQYGGDLLLQQHGLLLQQHGLHHQQHGLYHQQYCYFQHNWIQHIDYQYIQYFHQQHLWLCKWGKYTGEQQQQQLVDWCIDSSQSRFDLGQCSFEHCGIVQQLSSQHWCSLP